MVKAYLKNVVKYASDFTPFFPMNLLYSGAGLG